MAKQPKAPSLESSLEALETLVEEMESGELSLEESLKAFEQGVRLTRHCQQALKAAEQQVKILMSQSLAAEPEDFDPSREEGA